MCSIVLLFLVLSYCIRWSYFLGRKSVVGHLLIRNIKFGIGVAGRL
jgi:hypothetical protein